MVTDLRELCLNGAPPLPVCHWNENQSGHKKIGNKTHMKFQVLVEFNTENLKMNDKLACSSCFLAVTKMNRELLIESENDFNHYLWNLFSDLEFLLDNRVRFVREYAIMNEEGSTNCRHTDDYWAVYADGEPILMIKTTPPGNGSKSSFKRSKRDYKAPMIKSSDGADEKDDENDFVIEHKLQERQRAVPEDAIILDDEHVLGQMLDFLMCLQQYYGVSEVLGIVTTLQHFRIVGLPGCESLAATQDTTAPRSPTDVRIPSEFREILVSNVFALTEPDLMPMLLSVVRKAQSVKHYSSLPLLSHDRMYIILSSESWHWLRPKNEQVYMWRECLTLIPRGSLPSEGGEFMVLRPLHLMADTKVWLCMVKSVGNEEAVGTVCVVKQLYPNADAQREKTAWQMVNQCASVSVHTICNRTAVVIPFVIVARLQQDPQTSVKTVYDFNPHSWFYHDSVVVDGAADIPAVCGQFAARVKELAESKGIMSVDAAAVEAVTRMADQGWFHNDLEWRHVVLVPEYNEGSTDVSGVHAGLIDFEDAVKYTEPDGKIDMLERVKKLSEGVVFRV